LGEALIELDRRFERYRSWPLEAAMFAVVICTFVGTFLMLPDVRAALRAHGVGGVPAAFLAAPAFQVVVLLLLALLARWVARTERPFTRSWGEQRLLQELRHGVPPRVLEGAGVMDEAAVVIEERARRLVVRFLTFIGLLLTLQLAYVQFIVLSLASGHNPSRAGVLIVALISLGMVIFVAVQTARGVKRRKR
jgi:hypothetical protein